MAIALKCLSYIGVLYPQPVVDDPDICILIEEYEPIVVAVPNAYIGDV